MKKVFFVCCALLFCLAGLPAAHATICYVKADATGLNNGGSWTNAYTSLQSAVTANVDTIWIAAGVYKPTTGTDRTASFNLRGKVFGGFAGTETLLAQRDFNTNYTILSGDLGVQNDTADNSRTIVRATDISGGQINLLADGLIL